MKCTDVQIQLIDLLYEELPEAENAAIRNHLAACMACRTRWEELAEAHRLLNHAEPESLSPGLDVLSIYRRSARRGERAKARWRRIAAAATVVAVTIICALSAGLRIDVHGSRVELAWGPPEPAHAVEVPRFDDPWPVLSEQDERLRNVEELTSLATRDFLQSDRNRAARITQLKEQVERLQQDHALQLARLQDQNSERWRLVLSELFAERSDNRFVQAQQGQLDNPTTGRVRAVE